MKQIIERYHQRKSEVLGTSNSGTTEENMQQVQDFLIEAGAVRERTFNNFPAEDGILREEVGSEIDSMMMDAVHYEPLTQFLSTLIGMGALGVDSMGFDNEIDGRMVAAQFQKEREVVQNKVTSETVRLEKHVVISTYEIGQTSRDQEIPESLQNEIEVVQLSDEEELTDEETARNNELNVLVSKQNDIVAGTSVERICGVVETKKELRTTEISLSREDLKQHFGKKLDDAVKSLGVSRSTVKRACRLHGIKRWPFPKRKRVNHHHLSNPKQAATTAAAAQTVQNGTKAQDFGTVKAKYRDTIITFQLSFSSGIAKLVENITKRLPVMNGSFSMRYEDDEGDLVLIACDEDLNYCLLSWRLFTDKKPIRMFVGDESVTNEAP